MKEKKKRSPYPLLSSIETLLRPRIRLEIYLVLLIYTELNVSQLAKILGNSKATISRHCKEMHAENLLEFKEVETKGQFNPQFYKLNRATLDKFNPFASSKRNLPLDPADRLQYYQDSFITIKSLIYMIDSSFDLMQLMLDLMEKTIFAKKGGQVDIDLADEMMLKFIIPVQKVDFQGVLLSEKALPAFNKAYTAFVQTIRNLEVEDAKSENQKSVLFFNALMPLKDLLESNLT